jgi:hypothetical protein
MDGISVSLERLFTTIEPVAKSQHLDVYNGLAPLIKELNMFPNKPLSSHLKNIEWLNLLESISVRLKAAISFASNDKWAKQLGIRMSGTFVRNLKRSQQGLVHDIGIVQSLADSVSPPQELITKDIVEHATSHLAMAYVGKVSTTMVEVARNIILSKHMSSAPRPAHALQRIGLAFGRKPTAFTYDSPGDYDAEIPRTGSTIYDIDALTQKSKDTTATGLNYKIVQRLNSIRPRSSGSSGDIPPLTRKESPAQTTGMASKFTLDEMLRGPSRQIAAYHAMCAQSLARRGTPPIVLPDSQTTVDDIGNADRVIKSRLQRWQRRQDTNEVLYDEAWEGMYSASRRELALSALAQYDNLKKSDLLDIDQLPSHTSTKIHILQYGDSTK